MDCRDRDLVVFPLSNWLKALSVTLSGESSLATLFPAHLPAEDLRNAVSPAVGTTHPS